MPVARPRHRRSSTAQQATPPLLPRLSDSLDGEEEGPKVPRHMFISLFCLRHRPRGGGTAAGPRPTTRQRTGHEASTAARLDVDWTRVEARSPALDEDDGRRDARSRDPAVRRSTVVHSPFSLSPYGEGTQALRTDRLLML
eukprot:COSAG03_NODE_28_length_18724_cov_10.718128_29_plen_141_part_00